MSKARVQLRTHLTPLRTAWATYATRDWLRASRRTHPCLWGSRRAAIEASEEDEVVVQIAYQIVKVVEP